MMKQQHQRYPLSTQQNTDEQNDGDITMNNKDNTNIYHYLILD